MKRQQLRIHFLKESTFINSKKTIMQYYLRKIAPSSLRDSTTISES